MYTETYEKVITYLVGLPQQKGKGGMDERKTLNNLDRHTKTKSSSLGTQYASPPENVNTIKKYDQYT